VQQLILSGERQPRFFEGTYSQAAHKAREENKFLLVYLHSSMHSDSPRFCREVLCTENVASFLEENFILWGGDITTTEAYRLSNQFGVTSYPFFAVVANVSNTETMWGYLQSLNYNKRLSKSGTNLLYRKEGYIAEEQLMQALTDTLETHGPLLVAAKSEREERERERNLVEMQDREFLESLQRDREREQRRIEEENRRRMEEESRRREELEREEAKRKEELEREEKKKREELEKLERERKIEEQSRIILKTLPPEPEKSDKTTELMIRLTDGSRIRRRFLSTDPIDLVFAFVATKEIVDNKVLTTHLPRKTYSNGKMTLQEAGLCPQATMFVEEPMV